MGLLLATVDPAVEDIRTLVGWGVGALLFLVVLPIIGKILR